LRVDEEVRQSATLRGMSITPSALLDDLRRWAPLAEGDLLFTGTPSGVGRLHPGERVVADLRSSNGVLLSQIDLMCC